MRSLLADRSRFSGFLHRESQGVLEAAQSILHECGALTHPAAEIHLQRCLASAWREEATLTAELCNSAITPLDGEDLRALACCLTAVIEALRDVQAAAGRLAEDSEWPLDHLCRAALEYVGAVCELMPEPLQLANGSARLTLLRSRSMAMRVARRTCEAALLGAQKADACQWFARWSLIEEFRRLRSCLDDASRELQRVVLKNS